MRDFETGTGVVSGTREEVYCVVGRTVLPMMTPFYILRKNLLFHNLWYFQFSVKTIYFLIAKLLPRIYKYDKQILWQIAQIKNKISKPVLIIYLHCCVNIREIIL